METPRCENLMRFNATAPSYSQGQVAGYLEMLRYVNERLPQGGQAIEIGSHLGETAIMLACCCHFEQVMCVDKWEDDAVLKRFRENTAELRHGGELGYTQNTSIGAANALSGMFDFVYIDANHYYENITEDFHWWYPHVRPGGILAGHDYCSNWPGVMQAVDELVENKRLHKPVLFADSSWVLHIPLK